MPPKAKASSSIICLREPHFTDLEGNKWRHAMQIDFEGGAEWVSSIEWEDGCGAGWFEDPLLLLSIMAKLSAHSRQAFSLTRTVTPYICMPCVKICNKGKLEESWGWEHAQDVNCFFGSVFYINVSFPFFQSPRNDSSRLALVPEIEDHGKELLCRVDNPLIEDSAIEDSIVLDVHCE